MKLKIPMMMIPTPMGNQSIVTATTVTKTTIHDAIQVEDTELDWNMKKYQVNNDISIH